MQLFAQAIDENQFAQAAQNENENEKETKNKNKKRKTETTTNWPLGKLSLKPGCRYYFNGKQTYFNFNASQGGERFKKKKGQQGSKRAKCSIKSKSPQRKCKIRQRRSRNGNSIIQTGAGGVANGVVRASVSYSVPGSSRYALSGMG